MGALGARKPMGVSFEEDEILENSSLTTDSKLQNKFKSLSSLPKVWNMYYVVGLSIYTVNIWYWPHTTCTWILMVTQKVTLIYPPRHLRDFYDPKMKIIFQILWGLFLENPLFVLWLTLIMKKNFMQGYNSAILPKVKNC